jgi:ABC-type multidrug transport system ATPase subunit
MKSDCELTILFGLPTSVYQIPEGISSVGSSLSDTIHLGVPSVTLGHCRIEKLNSTCWVENTSSVRSTFVNGIRVDTKRELHTGDVLHLGEVCLQYRAKSQPVPRTDVFFVHGQRATEIQISEGLMKVGSMPECDVLVPAGDVSGCFAEINCALGQVTIQCLDKLMIFRINERRISRHTLALGDQIQWGSYQFEFTGTSLVALSSAVSLEAENLTLNIQGRRILARASLSVKSGEFVGIIGPTGAGKSTFLAALSGRHAADSGTVFFNGKNLYQNLGKFRPQFGWVPQQNIVHRELTVTQALEFSARLRLPRDITEIAMANIILKTAQRLGLQEKLASRIDNLSGGEIKKVSVAVELLSTPPLIFLDEPTSGLDPGAETNLMEMLRGLADGGCTVVTTTHNMANLALLDQLVIVAEGLIVYAGSPVGALSFFGVKTFPAIFKRLEERKPSEWRTLYENLARATPQPPNQDDRRPVKSQLKKTSFQFPVLLSRQLDVLCADVRNVLILIGQPLLIGLLLVWAVRGTMDDSALKLFFISVAVLWFGCSNGAPSIISEIAIYRRERMAGLHRSSYLISKWVFLSLITLFQSGILYSTAHLLGTGLSGTWQWQIAGLALISLIGSGIGLLISALARSPMQSILLVPLLIIPQIILSGYTVPASIMRGWVYALSQAIPSFQLQRIMDLSLLWQRTIDVEILASHLAAFQNLQIVMNLKMGSVVQSPTIGYQSLCILIAWVVVPLLLSFACLCRAEISKS